MIKDDKPPNYLKQLKPFINMPLIKVITGIHHAEKSMVNYQKYVITMDDFWRENIDGIVHQHIGGVVSEQKAMFQARISDTVFYSGLLKAGLDSEYPVVWLFGGLILRISCVISKFINNTELKA
ncbi:hypothetical protein RO21_03620 [[Actinobacillus] muris]|uniref:Uncharacterized protein n=1 Tax=Muribacter muris TaxID=67855 RepID=A0A0J5P832_9PAST|nr:hypothetical protein [Muribacter muris]KMK51925.1 hypothetical protein RO21_03620 [[Actinobacillus] muris] [Muribacter muris]